MRRAILPALGLVVACGGGQSPGGEVADASNDAKAAIVDSSLGIQDADGADAAPDPCADASAPPAGTTVEGAPCPDEAASLLKYSGAALVLAGLAAVGETEIIGLEYIDRGYERREETLSALGGQVQRASGIIPFSEPTGTFETSVYPSV